MQDIASCAAKAAGNSNNFGDACKMAQAGINCYPKDCCASMKTTVDALQASLPAGCTATCGGGGTTAADKPTDAGTTTGAGGGMGNLDACGLAGAAGELGCTAAAAAGCEWKDSKCVKGAGGGGMGNLDACGLAGAAGEVGCTAAAAVGCEWKDSKCVMGAGGMGGMGDMLIMAKCAMLVSEREREQERACCVGWFVLRAFIHFCFEA
jgi:hypothetical protein